MKKSIFSVVYMFIVTLVFTSMVSVARHYTHEMVELNEQAKMKRIILNVFGMSPDTGAVTGDVIDLFNNTILPFKLNNRTVYAALEADGKTPRGFALLVSGPGFWGPIHAVAAVDGHAERILGVRFYNHVETPGLGARISESWFFRQFDSLQINISGADDKLFSLHRTGKASGPKELNAITGATMTSQAVEAFLNREILRFAKEIREELRKDRNWPVLKT